MTTIHHKGFDIRVSIDPTKGDGWGEIEARFPISVVDEDFTKALEMGQGWKPELTPTEAVVRFAHTGTLEEDMQSLREVLNDREYWRDIRLSGKPEPGSREDMEERYGELDEDGVPINPYPWLSSSDPIYAMFRSRKPQ